MKINVPGRVYEFSQGGEAWLAYMRKEDPATSRELDIDQYEMWHAIEAGKQVNVKGGYYVIADLTPAAIEGLRYWAETLYSASGDDARDGDQDARNDQRAAARALERIEKATR